MANSLLLDFLAQSWSKWLATGSVQETDRMTKSLETQIPSQLNVKTLKDKMKIFTRLVKLDPLKALNKKVSSFMTFS